MFSAKKSSQEKNAGSDIDEFELNHGPKVVLILSSKEEVCR